MVKLHPAHPRGLRSSESAMLRWASGHRDPGVEPQSIYGVHSLPETRFTVKMEATSLLPRLLQYMSFATRLFTQGRYRVDRIGLSI